MQSKSIFLFLATLLTFGLVAMAHECYVCNNQGDNREKCVKTVKTCAIDETSCMSTVRWGSTPYWDPMGQKQYYISKRCARRDECEMERARNTRCDRIWYNDWECVECCFGDRCNYYITLGSNSISPMRALLTLVSALSIFIAHRGLSLG